MKRINHVKKITFINNGNICSLIQKPINEIKIIEMLKYMSDDLYIDKH